MGHLRRWLSSKTEGNGILRERRVLSMSKLMPRGGPSVCRILFKMLAAALFACLVATVPAQPSTASPAATDAMLLEESLQIEILSESEAVVRLLNRTQVLTEAGAVEYGHR